MIRAALGILLVMAVIVVALAMSGDPGRANLVWVNWRFGTTAAAAIMMIGLMSLLAVICWRIVLWIVEAPRRAARAHAETRRRQAADVLTRGFLAVAAGEGAEARRCAQKAADLAKRLGLQTCLAARSIGVRQQGECLPSKFRAFNWNVIEIDGNDLIAIDDAVEKAKATKGMPTMVVANTVKGKGVSFMEGEYGWHGKAPNKEERDKAISELDKAMELLGGE